MSDSFTWQASYLATLNESNKEKLTELVHAAETAILLRVQELAGSDNHHDERLELKAACEGLLFIQVNKLGWPAGLPSKPSPQND
jgi:hypothetical protein